MSHIKLPDLDTRNVLHIVNENFARAGLKAFAIRFIYTGEHGMAKDDAIHYFHKSVHYVNHSYTDIPVNGLLLIYDSYFVHIIEGSEDTVFRQVRFLLGMQTHYKEKMLQRDAEEDLERIRIAQELAIEEDRDYIPPSPIERPERIMFRRLKMLMVYHSITTLLFHDWRAVYGKPPSLVGKLDVYAPLSDHMEQLRVCIDKLEKLCDLSKEDPNLSFEGLSANDPKMEALPETALLDYLLTSTYTYSLEEVLSYHRRVDDHIFYFEQVWPLPTAFTPRHLYKLKIDDSFVEPLPVMPWEIQEREEAEAAKREEQDDLQQQSSSSD